MTDLDLHALAAFLHRSYSWTQKNWRELRHGSTGAALPRPFIGGEPGQRPLWRRQDLEAWKAGAASPAAVETAGDFPQRQSPSPPANDARPRPHTDRTSALRAAAGG